MKALTHSALFLVMTASAAFSNEFQSELEALANSNIAEIASSSEVIAAVKAQNGETAGHDQAKIDELDKTWRAETEAVDQPMIDSILDNSLSGYLADIQESSDGLYTEVFVMDAKGLNVGQSDVTSDYWQGDEAKWKETFGAGKGSVHVSELEQDDSTQLLQSQVSVPVVDPDSGEPIGAVTFGVNVEKL
ncbi:MAG: PDC sensor domain-containing protein [Roseibium sp.]